MFITKFVFVYICVFAYCSLTCAQLQSGDCDIYTEYFEPCTSNCATIPTCQNRYPQPYSGSCIAVCVPRCLCKHGYLRDQGSGRCVPIDQCPRICS
ncbi:unnamed protein product [Phaedon cochleariae]|uniref:TIL domain-containing protein n=1 Tax=Phaedon cochleariae TaxID=80249 RepID=A0A9P0DX51_PHACE|nr:unnamed protein product [Phaedon cochleariae]